MEWVRLGDIAEIRKGKKVDECQANVNTVRYIQIEDLRHNDDMKFTCDPKAVMADSEDVLIAWDGANAGTVGFDLEGAIGSTISKISIKENKKKELLPQYLGIFLQSKEDFLRQTTTGATIPHINKQALVQLAVPLFTLEIQNRIIELNNNLGSIIAKRREQIDALDALVGSVFYEMFGDFRNQGKYPCIQLSKIAEVSSSTRVFKKDLKSKGIPFFRGQEISALANGSFVESELFIAEDHYNSLIKKSGAPKMGDLLLPSIASEGQIWIVNSEEPFYFKDGRVLWIQIRSLDKLNSIYLKHLLKDMFVRDFESIASGTTFAELKIFLLRNLNITLPPIALQNRFADYVTSIEAQKESLHTSLAELETLFDALMQAAFSGHLN